MGITVKARTSIKNKGIVTDGLVFYVDAANSKSYPGTGTTWADLIGSNNGTLTNGPTYDSANGGSIVFAGDDDVVRGGQLQNGGGSGTSQSYSVWFKIDATPSDNPGLFYWDNYNGIFILATTREISIQTDGDNSIGDFATTPIASVDTWHNIAFNFNQGSSYECWLDGVSFGSASTADTSPAPGGSDIWRIGAREANGEQEYLNGNVAVVKAYNRALTSSEILQNYNALKNRFI